MPVTISVSETKHMGLTSRWAGDRPIWGVIFQLAREDGIGTAIGVTVCCEDEADAREQALSKLQGFLSEASAAAEALTPSTGSPEPAENDGAEALTPSTGSPEPAENDVIDSGHSDYP